MGQLCDLQNVEVDVYASDAAAYCHIRCKVIKDVAFAALAVEFQKDLVAWRRLLSEPCRSSVQPNTFDEARRSCVQKRLAGEDACTEETRSKEVRVAIFVRKAEGQITMRRSRNCSRIGMHEVAGSIA